MVLTGYIWRVHVCALQHGALCHCDGSRPEHWREEGEGGKQKAMNVTRVGGKKMETKGFIAEVISQRACASLHMYRLMCSKHAKML